jgi:hypothetical protein
MPDIDDGAGERLAVRRPHRAGHEKPLARYARRNVGAMRMLGRFVEVERAEYSGLGDARRRAVIDRIDQHGDAESIGQENEFLALVVAHPAGRREEVDRKSPFLLVGLISRASASMCRTTASLIWRMRGSGACPMRSNTASVIVCSSKFRMVVSCPILLARRDRRAIPYV